MQNGGHRSGQRRHARTSKRSLSSSARMRSSSAKRACSSSCALESFLPLPFFGMVGEVGVEGVGLSGASQVPGAVSELWSRSLSQQKRR